MRDLIYKQLNELFPDNNVFPCHSAMIGENVTIRNSEIHQGVQIGDGTTLKDARLEQDVALGSNVSVSDGLILWKASIGDNSYIEDAIIGREASIYSGAKINGFVPPKIKNVANAQALLDVHNKIPFLTVIHQKNKQSLFEYKLNQAVDSIENIEIIEQTAQSIVRLLDNKYFFKGIKFDPFENAVGDDKNIQDPEVKNQFIRYAFKLFYKKSSDRVYSAYANFEALQNDLKSFCNLDNEFTRFQSDVAEDYTWVHQFYAHIPSFYEANQEVTLFEIGAEPIEQCILKKNGEIKIPIAISNPNYEQTKNIKEYIRLEKKKIQELKDSGKEFIFYNKIAQDRIDYIISENNKAADTAENKMAIAQSTHDKINASSTKFEDLIFENKEAYQQEVDKIIKGFLGIE